MGSGSDYEFFNLRKEGKTYISKVFTFGDSNTERLRNVNMVTDGNEFLHIGEIDGALCLRLSGTTRKTQVTALVSNDDKAVKRLTFQSFQTRKGDWLQGYEKDSFTFRGDEFERLLSFLSQIKFVDFSNEDRFQIEDISRGNGAKILTDATDRDFLSLVKELPVDQRYSLLEAFRKTLSQDEINLLLGRKQGLEEYEAQLTSGHWSEAEWQNFFDQNQWVFGYGLDYRIMRQFDREMVVGGGSADNRNKPIIDFLMTFSDYTVLVEIKKPTARIFQGRSTARAGVWRFSTEFTDAVSQALEQKAEWLSCAHSAAHFDKAGSRRLEARTRNAKTILVFGRSSEFGEGVGARDADIRRDTFELFRREMTSIEIVTYDEMLERARFIVHE
ncbi:Shedu immune nuclease family protein [Pelagibacterium limicola]|uniref:Shedu immune nuclease family protein n=1 Tax=Pelagibacterium limicola TaxID=2791022 RepID=UPI0018AF8F1D|nr:Shedu immune nuclease family protein [Pelagibacterium limicola]